MKRTHQLSYMQIDHATGEHGGTYLCSISNVLEERWTEAVDVGVGKHFFAGFFRAFSFPFWAWCFRQTLLPLFQLKSMWRKTDSFLIPLI